MQTLSDRHWEVLAWIGDFTSEQGRGPTVTEILDGIGDQWAHAVLGDLCSRSLLECDESPGHQIGGLRRVAR